MRKLLSLVLITLVAVIGQLSSQTFNCGDTLIDTRDGKKYATVLIGTTCWMKQNLNYGQFVASVNTGTPHSDVSNNSVVEKYCFNNIAANCDVYGGLYDWDEMMNYTSTNGGQGICPSGWHMATVSEYSALAAFVSNSGNALKAVGQGVGSGAGTNTSGFSALLGGDRGSPGVFTGTTHVGIYWTSTQANPGVANHIYLMDVNDSLKFMATQKSTGFSCRCVKNASTGLNERTGVNQFNVYPNPAREKVTIELANFPVNASYRIVNVVGWVIREEKITGIKTEIPLGDLYGGVYFISVTTSSGGMERKVIVAR